MWGNRDAYATAAMVEKWGFNITRRLLSGAYLNLSLNIIRGFAYIYKIMWNFS